MENSSNQRVQPSSRRKVREDDIDIREGARQTDQLDKMKEGTEHNPNTKENNAGTPADVTVENGDEK